MTAPTLSFSVTVSAIIFILLLDLPHVLTCFSDAGTILKTGANNE